LFDFFLADQYTFIAKMRGDHLGFLARSMDSLEPEPSKEKMVVAMF